MKFILCLSHLFISPRTRLSRRKRQEQHKKYSEDNISSKAHPNIFSPCWLMFVVVVYVLRVRRLCVVIKIFHAFRFSIIIISYFFSRVIYFIVSLLLRFVRSDRSIGHNSNFSIISIPFPILFVVWSCDVCHLSIYGCVTCSSSAVLFNPSSANDVSWSWLSQNQSESHRKQPWISFPYVPWEPWDFPFLHQPCLDAAVGALR